MIMEQGPCRGRRDKLEHRVESFILLKCTVDTLMQINVHTSVREETRRKLRPWASLFLVVRWQVFTSFWNYFRSF